MPGQGPRWRWRAIRASSSQPCRSASPHRDHRRRLFRASLVRRWRAARRDRAAPAPGTRGRFALVIALVTYFSLVIGELCPSNWRCARPSRSRWSWRCRWRRWRGRPRRSSGCSTARRLRAAADRGAPQGRARAQRRGVANGDRRGDPRRAIEEDERQIMTGIMRLADRPVRELMTRAPSSTPSTAGPARPRFAPRSRRPAFAAAGGDGSPDNIVGVVKVKEVLAVLLAGRKHRSPG